MHALERFHTAHPNLALAVNVTRHPYSFIGDSKQSSASLDGYNVKVPKSTWHDSLLGYMGNDPKRRDDAEQSMAKLGRQAGISFDYNVLTQWQPIESQRLLLWAGKHGLAEEFMTNLNHRHFEHQESASMRATLLNAAEEVGLDRRDANAFLDTKEYEEDVWQSYGSTIHEKGIHSIPMFVYHVPVLNISGGPFRARGVSGREPYVVRGSMSEDYFFKLFETIASEVSEEMERNGGGGGGGVETHDEVQTMVQGGDMCGGGERSGTCA